MKFSEAYFLEVARRMDKGEVEYKDKSWSKDPEALISEIMEELADVAGWAGIAWTRLNKLREVVHSIKADPKVAPDKRST